MNTLIYKILTASQHADALAGAPVAAPIDVADGYVHFSTSAQLQDTLTKWFAGQSGLVVLAFEADGFGAALKWEAARGGQLFPHVYGRVDASASVGTWPVASDADGAPLSPILVETSCDEPA